MIPIPDPKLLQQIVDTYGQRAWVEIVSRYGKTFRVGDLVMTCEPEAVRALLMDRPHTEQRPTAHRLMNKLPGAQGVLFLDGEPWRARAKALAAPFHRNTVDSHAGHVHATAVTHAEQWASSARHHDLYDAVQQLGAATVLVTGYGLDPENADAIALAQALVAYKQRTMSADPTERIDTLVPRPDMGRRIVPVIWKMWWAHRRVRLAVRRALASRTPADSRPNWIAQLLEAKLSGSDLANEINHLYGAFNAIDYVSTCALCELARDPQLTLDIRRELDQTLASRQVPTRDDLARMRLTSGFILEVLRRYPVSMSVHRQTGEPLELGGETLPAGTQVAILLHALHHHPDFWDDPDAFKPLRWASASPRVPYSYVPFLLGARKCMGRDMAEQQLLLTIAAIVRRFNIAIHGEPVVPPFMIPRFASPIPFSLTPADA